MRHPVCTTIAAACALACGTAAEAQSPSRADLEFGAWTVPWGLGFEMGVTGWVSDHSGFAARGLVTDDRIFDVYRVNPRGFEAQYRHRRFRDVWEIDFGAGLMFLTGTDANPFRGAGCREYSRPWTFSWGAAFWNASA